jgi:hypothetical protein
MERDEIDERLARLMAATEGVAPREGFAARVMGAVQSERAVGLWAFLPRAAKRTVPFAAIAACAAIAWAVFATRDADDAVAGSLDTVEVEW